MSIKVQTTLTGYPAWVFQRLMESLDHTPAETAAMIFDRWVLDNRDFLADQGITRDRYRRASESEEAVVLTIDRSRGG